MFLVAVVFVAPFFLTTEAMASTQSNQVGVYVEPRPTTIPPPATTAPPPRPTTTLAPSTSTPPNTQPTTTLPRTDSGDGVGLSGMDGSTSPTDESSADKGVVASVKNAAAATKKAVTDVLKGKPVADVVQEVLPEPVAAVVVPAVRTASTFAFPIGLAVAVFGFLGIQQRIDSADPKLAAAPLAHDEDMVYFE